MKLHFIKKKESRSDLQVAVSKKNKVIKKKYNDKGRTC